MKQDGRNFVSRLVHSKSDKDDITAWKLELHRILQVFNVRSEALTSSFLTILFSDRVGLEHPHDSYRHIRDSF